MSESGPHANQRQDVHLHRPPVLEAYVPIAGGIRYAYLGGEGQDTEWLPGRCRPGEALVFESDEVHYVQYDGPCVVVKGPRLEGDVDDKIPFGASVKAAARAACPPFRPKRPRFRHPT